MKSLFLCSIPITFKTAKKKFLTHLFTTEERRKILKENRSEVKKNEKEREEEIEKGNKMVKKLRIGGEEVLCKSN